MKRPPVRRSPEVEQRVLDGIASGKSLRQTCAVPGMPDPSTVIYWTQRDSAFGALYDEAVERRAWLWGEEVVELSDRAMNAGSMHEVQGLKLAVDQRRWMLSRLLPQRYGDHVSVSHGHVHAIVTLPDNGRLLSDDEPLLIERDDGS